MITSRARSRPSLASPLAAARIVSSVARTNPSSSFVSRSVSNIFTSPRSATNDRARSSFSINRRSASAAAMRSAPRTPSVSSSNNGSAPALESSSGAPKTMFFATLDAPCLSDDATAPRRCMRARPRVAQCGEAATRARVGDDET